jgi:hypothetical protein
MSVREEIRQLVSLGPLPPSASADESRLQTYEDLLKQISRPVTDEEARALIRLFGPDDCFGLAWTVLHLIESAPNWPIKEAIPPGSRNEWIQRLRERAEQGGRL